MEKLVDLVVTNSRGQNSPAVRRLRACGYALARYLFSHKALALLNRVRLILIPDLVQVSLLPFSHPCSRNRQSKSQLRRETGRGKIQRNRGKRYREIITPQSTKFQTRCSSLFLSFAPLSSLPFFSPLSSLLKLLLVSSLSNTLQRVQKQALDAVARLLLSPSE